MTSATFVVIGGGIAGVTCVEYLGLLAPNEKVILITASALIKTVTDVTPLSRTLYTYTVSESNAEKLKLKHPNLEIVYDKVVKINSLRFEVITGKTDIINYQYLCVCTGGTPNIIPQAKNNINVVGIRDTDSVKNYQEKISQSRRIVIVGNGGIASELVHATKGIEIVWVIKDKHITSTFVDPGASEFFQASNRSSKNPDAQKTTIKRLLYCEENLGNSSGSAAALGPDWLKDKTLTGTADKCTLNILYQTHIKNIKDSESHEWPLSVELSNGSSVECDLIVSATGVNPFFKIECDKQFKLGPDGGLAVDWKMETSVSKVFAAGDVCFADWQLAEHWFQMRLWTQAHQMGAMAARSMNAAFKSEEILQDFCFELFTHTTKLFGYQVVLLGKFNGQGFGTNYEILIRSTPNMEYIKFVLVDNKLQGAILIGETGLEETCENLILNQLDLSPYGDDILNPDIDIEDYFD